MIDFTSAPRLAAAGLFAGIGGLELGLQKAGIDTRLFCEIDKGAQAVLKKRFPDVPVVSDIRSLNNLPDGTQVVTAGFPCQDLSSAGPKGGIGGERSSLIDEVFRLIDGANDLEWLVIENVKFMLQLAKGQAMRHITDRLNELGFNWAYRTINTESFGLPQRRHRVYIVASRSHDPRPVLLSDEHGRQPNLHGPDSEVPTGFYWTEGQYSTGLNYNGVPPLKGGSTIGIPSPPAILFPDGQLGTPEIRDAERLQGFPVNWTGPAESVVRSSHRWKLIGNAVSVPVAEWVARGLTQARDEYDGSNDTPLGRGKWPGSAWCMGGEIFRSDRSEWPVRRKYRGLDRFLKYPIKPLSTKAANGYLKRARRGNLYHPEGFLESVSEHALREIIK